MKLLFVCGRNKRRSPTAAAIFQNDDRVSVRSAGVGETSRRRLSVEDLEWADLVLVMEQKYKTRIQQSYGRVMNLPPVKALGIADEYAFMDAELIEIISEAIESMIAS